MTAEEVLQFYYRQTDLSQPDLASRLNVSQGTIHNWLSGKRKIPMEQYPMIAELCDVSLDEILPGNWNQMLGRNCT